MTIDSPVLPGVTTGPYSTVQSIRAVELAPRKGPAAVPVRITLRLPPRNALAAFRVLFGGIEADTQLANEETLPDYDRIVLVSPVPTLDTARVVQVVVHGLSKDGQVVERMDAGSFAYTSGPRGSNAAAKQTAGQMDALSSIHAMYGADSPDPDSPGITQSVSLDLRHAQVRPTSLHGDTSTMLHGSQAFASRDVRVGLRFTADLNTMARGWNRSEYLAKRRLVQFWRQQDGNIVNATFRPVQPEHYEPDSIVVSCIYREDQDECFITSVDTLYLLEALLGVCLKSAEKTRLRRTLEGYKPITISKNRSEHGEFFSTIMSFPDPRPRTIEKDLKVFHWRIVASALKKIISRYNATHVLSGLDAVAG